MSNESQGTKNISILVPCFNEADMLPLFYSALCQVLGGLTAYEFELLFVDDGSSDATLAILQQLAQRDARVHYLALSRNFGKEAAMLAGLDAVQGAAVIIMDADLQDPPGLIPELLAGWEAGYDDVYAQRQGRPGDSAAKRLSSRLYYRLLRHFSAIPVLADVGDFRLLDRKCITALCQLREYERYTKGFFSWIGFRKLAVPYDRPARAAGHTKWGWSDLVRLGLDGLTSFSTLPLRLSTWLGLLSAGGALLYMVWVVVKTLLYGDPVAGYPSLVSIILFVSGVQLIVLGIIGEYLGKTYCEVKRRPVYLIREKNF